MFELVVTRPFAGRLVGDLVVEPADVAAILAGPHAGKVVKRYALAKPLVTVAAAPDEAAEGK